MKTPLVSVVMPVYNGERFVGEAIQSIRNQTFADFELIVVDDGSKDSTPGILHAQATADPRIRVHRLEKNLGVIGARNTGMNLASGDLIAAMDADDVAVPERLALQAAFLRDHPDVDLVGGYVRIIDERGQDGVVKVCPTTPGLTAWSFLFMNGMHHPTAMMRRSVHQALGGYSAQYRGGSEDFDFFSRASRGRRIANLPAVLLRYRRWGGNMTTAQWDAQEGSANQIVSESVEHFTGTRCDLETARSLRGLATDRYPATTAEIQSLADLLPKLCRGFLMSSPVPPSEHGEVRRDAAIKLWLLAALAARRSPALAVRIGGVATRLRPTSLFPFLRKVARRVAS